MNVLKQLVWRILNQHTGQNHLWTPPSMALRVRICQTRTQQRQNLWNYLWLVEKMKVIKQKVFPTYKCGEGIILLRWHLTLYWRGSAQIFLCLDWMKYIYEVKIYIAISKLTINFPSCWSFCWCFPVKFEEKTTTTLKFS